VKMRFEPYFTGVRRGSGEAKKIFNIPLAGEGEFMV